ncbi:TRAP transporter substrate-binding protein [Oceanobacillus senegalensis]|uniref:TRAP transporter substrate-binding protein n=1 Tax=Oceanobacillus senegalensis TaxID=1936063 RepID=UPI000A308EAD|nr:TRAP transporter substrate-binding protein [Oceanobacillus senegalensis]
MRKKWLGGLLFAFILMVLVACSGGSDSSNSDQNSGEDSSSNSTETITIQAAHVVSQDATQHDMYLKFKELVEEKSDGRIVVDVYPDGQLGGEREMVENTQAGNIQITSPSVGVLSNFSSALEVFDFPFIFKDREAVYQVFDGSVGAELLAGLEESGLIGLGYSENGWRHLSNTKEEIVTPDQVEGLKLRTMEVPMHIEFWKELGANPTPMAFTEVFTGLSSGVVEGVENPFQLIYTGKFHEPSNYITTTGHIFDPEILVINKEFFEGLSEENQEIIQTSANEAIQHLRDLNKDLDDELREKLIDEGAIITDLSDEEHNAWVEASIPFYEKFTDEVDKEMLINILEAAGNEKILNAISE